MKIGIIGGSGLENLNIFEEAKEITIETPYGSTSSSLYSGTLANGTEVFILSRHGRGHTITPTHVNNRANIAALKQLGVNQIIATTACGSLREEIGIGDLVIPDQFIDFTRLRPITFYDTFEEGNPNHVAMPDPFDQKLRDLIIRKAKDTNIPVHTEATVITIEGPRFSTRAESKMFRMWGADIINMSTAPEIILANEAQIPYAAIAISTDYDSWKGDENHVTWEEVFKVFAKRTDVVKTLLSEIIQSI